MSSGNVENTLTSVDKENSKTDINDISSSSDSWYKFKAGLFLTSVTGIGFLAGFGSSLASIKKKGITLSILALTISSLKLETFKVIRIYPLVRLKKVWKVGDEQLDRANSQTTLELCLGCVA